MPDTSEPAVAGRDVSGEHLFDPVAKSQVGVTDDRLDDRAAALLTLFRGGDREVRLTDRSYVRPPVGAVAGQALDIHGPQDPVSGVRVGKQVVEGVCRVGVIPEMVMRVADRQPRLENLLDNLG